MIQQSDNSPRVSVLMTIYNAGDYLREAIDSLIQQTFSDWELIAVENGSTDHSPSILSSYNDPRIRVFPLDQNIGRTPALRYAFERAQGEYVAVLDADDISNPARLKRQVQYLDRCQDVSLLGTWVKVVDENGKHVGDAKPPADKKKLYEILGWANPFVHSSTIYRRVHAAQVGGYPSWVTYAQDYGFYLSLAKKYGIAVLDDFLCFQRVLPTQMTSSKKMQKIISEEQVKLLQYASESLHLSARGNRLNKRSQSVSKIRLGLALFSEGERLKGAGKIMSNILKKPSTLWGNGPVRRFFGSQV